MATLTLFENDDHHNFLLEDFDDGDFAIQSNQHLIVHGGAAMILDPGGHKIYNKVLSETHSLLRGAELKHIFLSHQDPDIVAALNGWLMTTDADAFASKLWLRFIPHFGLDHLMRDRLKGIDDGGTVLDLDGAEMWVLPAHFLHSTGNFHVYDTVSKILYTGDLGASIDNDYREVPDFDAHIPSMDGFHRRYMGGNKAMRGWAEMVRELDIDVIAPQHGALFKGSEMVGRFIDWIAELECGMDVLEYRLPKR